ncbi:titin-like, partial [Limulus polyphemus]|uniref:Titin-like n=1 Tax=Limulus polyphemus TaxID=6850 RepID=A0ABM1BCT3_LIMPO
RESAQTLPSECKPKLKTVSFFRKQEKKQVNEEKIVIQTAKTKYDDEGLEEHNKIFFVAEQELLGEELKVIGKQDVLEQETNISIQDKCAEEIQSEKLHTVKQEEVVDRKSKTIMRKYSQEKQTIHKPIIGEQDIPDQEMVNQKDEKKDKENTELLIETKSDEILNHELQTQKEHNVVKRKDEEKPELQIMTEQDELPEKELETLNDYCIDESVDKQKSEELVTVPKDEVPNQELNTINDYRVEEKVDESKAEILIVTVKSDVKNQDIEIKTEDDADNGTDEQKREKLITSEKVVVQEESTKDPCPDKIMEKLSTEKCISIQEVSFQENKLEEPSQYEGTEEKMLDQSMEKEQEDLDQTDEILEKPILNETTNEQTVETFIAADQEKFLAQELESKIQSSKNESMDKQKPEELIITEEHEILYGEPKINIEHSIEEQKLKKLIKTEQDESPNQQSESDKEHSVDDKQKPEKLFLTEQEDLDQTDETLEKIILDEATNKKQTTVISIIAEQEEFSDPEMETTNQNNEDENIDKQKPEIFIITEHVIPEEKLEPIIKHNVNESMSEWGSKKRTVTEKDETRGYQPESDKEHSKEGEQKPEKLILIEQEHLDQRDERLEKPALDETTKEQSVETHIVIEEEISSQELDTKKEINEGESMDKQKPKSLITIEQCQILNGEPETIREHSVYGSTDEQRPKELITTQKDEARDQQSESEQMHSKDENMNEPSPENLIMIKQEELLLQELEAMKEPIDDKSTEV